MLARSGALPFARMLADDTDRLAMSICLSSMILAPSNTATGAGMAGWAEGAKRKARAKRRAASEGPQRSGARAQPVAARRGGPSGERCPQRQSAARGQPRLTHERLSAG